MGDLDRKGGHGGRAFDIMASGGDVTGRVGYCYRHILQARYLGKGITRVQRMKGHA